MSLVVNSIKFCLYCGVAGHACIGSFSLTLGNVWQSLADSHCWGGVFAGLYNLMLHKTKSHSLEYWSHFGLYILLQKKIPRFLVCTFFRGYPHNLRVCLVGEEIEELISSWIGEMHIDDPILWSQKLRPLWSYFLNDFYNYGENTLWDHFLDDEFIYTSYFIF